MGSMHVRAIGEIADVELAAVYSSDPQKLAGLSVILASAAIALIDGRALKPEHCHAQLEVFRQANLKIIDRCNAAIASLRN